MEYDSIPINKPRALKSLYQINHPKLNQISLKEKAPKEAFKAPNKFLGNFSGGAVTLLTGITTSSSTESIWMKEDELVANNTEFNWNVQLYFPGMFEKTRERVKNDDGSTSLSTEKGIYVDWRNGADGIIFEKSDTIGRFALKTNFTSEKEIQNWLSRIDSESRVGIAKPYSYGNIPEDYNFAITGILRNQNFSIISSGKTFRSVIFIENKPIAIFQSDPNQIVLGKKNKPAVYLLSNKPATIDQTDLFRLSMLSRLVSKTIAVDYFAK
ncbi:MAG: hypothetical protein V1779_00630 [bacterium]